MISNFWSSVEKWQERFMEVCNEDKRGENCWYHWFVSFVTTSCGYCVEFHCSIPGGEPNCPLHKNKSGCFQNGITIYSQLYDACKKDDYDQIVVLTWQMLQAVSNPKNMRYFKK